MTKPTPLQVRNLLVAVFTAGIGVFNYLRGGPVWLTAMFGIGCVLAIGSAVLNNGAER